jgi:hypothetical protein
VAPLFPPNHLSAFKQVRLASGNTRLEGRVEHFYRGRWTTVSMPGSQNYQNAERIGRIVCRELSFDFKKLSGFTNANMGHFGSTQAVKQYQVDVDTPVVEVICNSHNYLQLDQCSVNEVEKSHDTDIVIECQETANTANVRLQNGPSEKEGRLQVYVGNTWYTVSSNGWETGSESAQRNANVACRQLGYGFGQYLGTTAKLQNHMLPFRRI